MPILKRITALIKLLENIEAGKSVQTFYPVETHCSIPTTVQLSLEQQRLINFINTKWVSDEPIENYSLSLRTNNRKNRACVTCSTYVSYEVFTPSSLTRAVILENVFEAINNDQIDINKASILVRDITETNITETIPIFPEDWVKQSVFDEIGVTSINVRSIIDVCNAYMQDSVNKSNLIEYCRINNASIAVCSRVLKQLDQLS